MTKQSELLSLANMNDNASALGRMSKGKTKNITPEERQRRAERMRAAQKSRWKGYVKKAVAVLLMFSTLHAAEPWKPLCAALDKPTALPGIVISGNATRLTLSGGYVIRATASSRPVVLRGVVAKVGHRITTRALPGEPEMVGGVVMLGYDAIK